MLYISLDFSLFPLIFPPILGIDHLENVSIRYRYSKVLGYRVLGNDIDPALFDTQNSLVCDTPVCMKLLLELLLIPCVAWRGATRLTGRSEGVFRLLEKGA